MIKFKKEHIAPMLSKNSKFGPYELAVAFNIMQETSSINTGRRAIGFISQVAHETGGFQWLTELGGRSYFKKYEVGTSIGKNLGNTKVGDGYKYRGRGFIQLTGRYNYTQFQKHLDKNYPDYRYNVIKNPELVAELPLALEAGIWYWENRELNHYADKCDVRGMTRRINGGFNGLADRMTRYELLGELVDSDS